MSHFISFSWLMVSIFKEPLGNLRGEFNKHRSHYPLYQKTKDLRHKSQPLPLKWKQRWGLYHKNQLNCEKCPVLDHLLGIWLISVTWESIEISWFSFISTSGKMLFTVFKFIVVENDTWSLRRFGHLCQWPWVSPVLPAKCPKYFNIRCRQTVERLIANSGYIALPELVQ